MQLYDGSWIISYEKLRKVRHVRHSPPHSIYSRPQSFAVWIDHKAASTDRRHTQREAGHGAVEEQCATNQLGRITIHRWVRRIVCWQRIAIGREHSGELLYNGIKNGFSAINSYSLTYQSHVSDIRRSNVMPCHAMPPWHTSCDATILSILLWKRQSRCKRDKQCFLE